MWWDEIDQAIEVVMRDLNQDDIDRLCADKSGPVVIRRIENEG